VKLDPKVVAELAIPFRPKAYLQVMPKAHAAIPLGMGFGQTRFAAPDKSFLLVYLARNTQGRAPAAKRCKWLLQTRQLPLRCYIGAET
jgi:hypothetical protein